MASKLYQEAVRMLGRYIYQRGKHHSKDIGLKRAKELAEVVISTVERLVEEY